MHTQRQAVLLRGLLGERGLDVTVTHAMRYGAPSLPSVLRGLREKNLARLLVLPLYVPVLVVGAGALDAAAAGLGAGAHLLLLGAFLVMAVAFAPWVAAVALRIAHE